MSKSEGEPATAEQDHLTVALLVLRVITIAFAISVLVFVEISIVIVGDRATGGMSIIVWGAFGVAIAAIVASWIIPGRLSFSRALEELGAEKMLALYTTRLLVGLAILVGAAFLTVVAFLVKARWPTLGATAVLVVMILAKFPTRSGLDRWIKEQRQIDKLGGTEQE